MAQLVRVRGWVSALVLAGAVHFLTVAPATAQCVLCYASVAASGNRGIRVLQIGILILLVPTLAILSGLVWVAVRRRNSDSGAADDAEMEPRWEEGSATLDAPTRTSTAAGTPGINALSPRV